MAPVTYSARHDHISPQASDVHAGSGTDRNATAALATISQWEQRHV
jgi:hypothetical protein